MGRDGALPRGLSYILPRVSTPVIAIMLIGVVGLVGLFVDITTSASFINFGAFSAFTLVNLSVIAHFLRRRSERGVGSIFGWVIVPLAGAIVDLYLLMNLDGRAKLVGLAWLVIGVIWLAWLTRGFRKEPPRISIEEETGDTT